MTIEGRMLRNTEMKLRNAYDISRVAEFSWNKLGAMKRQKATPIDKAATKNQIRCFQCTEFGQIAPNCLNPIPGRGSLNIPFRGIGLKSPNLLKRINNNAYIVVVMATCTGLPQWRQLHSRSFPQQTQSWSKRFLENKHNLSIFLSLIFAYLMWELIDCPNYCPKLVILAI